MQKTFSISHLCFGIGKDNRQVAKDRKERQALKAKERLQELSYS
jgi:hypothetical protein